MTAESRRCAVLGSPIGHSLSPVLHRAAYAALGLSWTYDRFEVRESELADFVAGLDGSWRGLSLTMPLKEVVLDLGEVDAVARLTGAGNTLVLHDDGPRVYNTDVAGLVNAIRRVHSARLDHVILLGSGATARSAVVACAELGASLVSVVARNPVSSEPLLDLGRRLGLTMHAEGWTDDLPGWSTVISTVPAGGADAFAESLVQSASLVVDAIYAPWPTVLAQRASVVRAAVVSGRDMLVGQALRQIELMTGQSVPADTLYKALPA